MSRAPIFTIGHSDRTWEELIDALRNQEVKFVVDVRTTPKSKRHAHLNLEVLRTALPQFGFKYLHLGGPLGARREDPQLLDNDGLVSYPKVWQTPEFRQAIERIEKGADAGHRIALMCTEPHPCECHRFPMIATPLARDGYEVQHILRDGTVKTQSEIEDDLLERFGPRITAGNLFEPEIDRAGSLELAYEKLNVKLAKEQLQKSRRTR